MHLYEGGENVLKLYLISLPSISQVQNYDSGFRRLKKKERKEVKMFLGTSLVQREKLANAGFIRVDGLISRSPLFGEKLVKKSQPGSRRWDQNNGKIAIAIDGEVWLRFPVLSKASEQFSYRKLLTELDKIGPFRQGIFVPCSNGENIKEEDILNRQRDPDWFPG